MRTTQKPIVEKKHRLAEEIYEGHVIVSFTLCIKNRIPIFTQHHIVNEFVRILADVRKQYGCEIIVYLFMSDHCHIILQGMHGHAKPLDAIKAFKQKTGFWLARNFPHVRWQKDFYDHILRKDEDIRKHIQYVLQNPVRKGIVDDWKKYEFKGSTVYNFAEWD
ncbi:MAG: transposase [Ignavibacteriae bacterium]|nr:transposase [Ignavibacteriota bacterium]